MLKNLVESEKPPALISGLKLKIDSYHAHYLHAGNGPAIVLLHGGASDSRDWLTTMPALADRYCLYAPDLIGYGRSDNPKSAYYLADLVKFTMDFIEGLRLDSPVLVGHSLGGRIALELALRHPEKVGKLVLIDSVGFGKMTPWGNFIVTLDWMLRKLKKQPQPYPTLLKATDEAPHWVCLNELPDLKVPTLIVWKRREPYYPLRQARKARKLIPGARLAVVPGIGHAPHKEKDNPFIKILLSFLEQ